MTEQELKEKITNAHYVCQNCGEKYGRGFADGKKQFVVSTWHEGECEICGKIDIVTEFRDFGYAKNMNL